MAFTISTIASLYKSDSTSRVTIDSASQGVGPLTLRTETSVVVDVDSSESLSFGSMTTAKALWIRPTEPVVVKLNGDTTGFEVKGSGVVLLLDVEVTSVTLTNSGVSQSVVLVRAFGV